LNISQLRNYQISLVKSILQNLQVEYNDTLRLWFQLTWAEASYERKQQTHALSSWQTPNPAPLWAGVFKI